MNKAMEPALEPTCYWAWNQVGRKEVFQTCKGKGRVGNKEEAGVGMG